MDKHQAQKLINELFTQSFHRERYQHFLRNLLNNIEKGSRGGKQYTGNFIPDAYKQHVNQYWCLGKYVDPDGEELDLLVVEVKSLAKLDRARSALRNFAVNRLKQFEKEVSLIAFYAKDDGGEDWRFSFVKIEHEAYQDEKGKVKLKQELTPARRYSYLVGVHENSHTASKQLLPILSMDYADPRIEEIEAAFSIEKVTDEFFEQYKALFKKLAEHLKKQKHFQRPNEEETDQAVSRFAKKLLGQIVFLYFLQKKGWLGVPKGDQWGKGSWRFMRERFERVDNEGGGYYHDFLQYLFYEALACERNNQSDPGYYKRFDCRVPFLNGGLFEADYDWQKESLDLPNHLFHNNEKNKAGDDGTGILDVFGRYNFTIKEDEPLDKEVAVDPEMLGKVFENMLEVTERKSKGAFYTPREIVHYMCQESLINYLDNTLNTYAHHADGVVDDLFPGKNKSEICVPKEDLVILIRKGHLALENDQRVLNKGKETDTYKFQLPESVRTHALDIDKILTTIKVCDPAIGSGAFPVGLLHEIVNARLALVPHSGNPQSAYELKRHAIGESIYGVDIDASAIDIARLRLWLSLIVDEEDYGNIEALPNLDYKIMQGNSLVEEYWGVKLFNEEFIQEDDQNKAKIQKLKECRSILEADLLALHEANQLTADKKRQLVKKAKNIDKSIKDLQESKDKDPHLELFDTRSEAKKKAGQLEQLHKEFFSASSAKKKQIIRQRITSLEWDLIEATLKERDQLDSLKMLEQIKQAKEKPFFLWKLNFSEVFKQNGGFDVVIGNPPYVQIQSFRGQQIQKDWEAQKYDVFAKKGDVYCLFYEKGHRLLRNGGVLTFITSNKWMRAGYGEKLRQFFLNHTDIDQLIDFGDSPIFSEATTYTNIMLFRKGATKTEPRAWDLSSAYRKATSLVRMLDENPAGAALFGEDAFVITSPAIAVIKKKVEAVGKPLKMWDIAINYGIKTGFNEAFIIDDKRKVELIAKNPKSAEIIKPILRGRDIKRYLTNFADLWVIVVKFGAYKTLADQYPEIYKHLQQYEEKLKARGQCRYTSSGKQSKGDYPGQHHWLELDNNPKDDYLAAFEEEKVVWLEMSPTPNFAFSADEIFVLNTSYILTGEKLKWILAIANSSVLDCYFPLISTDVRGKTRRYTKQYVERLPIIRYERSSANYLEPLVDYIQLAKTTDNKLLHTYFEQLIDGLVYELYFPDEIKAADKAILPYMGEIKPLTNTMSEEEKLAVIKYEFERLYDPNHPVRNHLETLDSVEVVRTIRDVLKK